MMKPETSLLSPLPPVQQSNTQEAATPVFNSFIPENRSRKGQNSYHANQRLKDETKRGIREKALFIRREGCYCK
jgi:hypothetical protein